MRAEDHLSRCAESADEIVMLANRCQVAVLVARETWSSQSLVEGPSASFLRMSHAPLPLLSEH
jgi:hypothetical protein